MKKIIRNSLAILSILTLSSCGDGSQNSNSNNPQSISIIYNNEAINKLDVEVGNTYTLSASVSPTTASQEVSWEVSDSSVASISASGVLSIANEGNAIVTAVSKVNKNIKSNLYIFASYGEDANVTGNGFTSDTPILSGVGDEDPLEIYFLEVRQMYADAIYIKKGKFDMLIDAGEAFDGTYVNSFLKEKMEDNRLDVLMASHGDGDHINGMVNALKDVKFVSTIIDYGGVQSSGYSNRKQEFINKGAVYHTAYDCINDSTNATNLYYLTKDVTLKILNTGNYCANDKSNSSNPYSVACLFTYKDFKFFTAGDITADVESKLLVNEDLPNVTLYKASHHGSKGSNTQNFMNKLNPKGVAISAARYSTIYGVAPSEKPSKSDTNQSLSGGHPHAEAISRIYKIPNIMATLDVHWNAVNGTMCYTTYGTNSYTFHGSTPMKGYYDLSLTNGVAEWDDSIQDFKNKVTGEEDKKLHETVVFKTRNYTQYVEGLI